MKTHVLIISEKYPATHKRAGENTDFYAKIVAKMKIHTIRQNYPYWEKRIQEVKNGEAVLSVRTWTGKPYRSKQIELFRFTKDDPIGIQKYVFLESTVPISIIAKNDGLSRFDFLEWFSEQPIKEPMAMIHFTDFRYNLKG